MDYLHSCEAENDSLHSWNPPDETRILSIMTTVYVEKFQTWIATIRCLYFKKFQVVVSVGLQRGEPVDSVHSWFICFTWSALAPTRCKQYPLPTPIMRTMTTTNDHPTIRITTTAQRVSTIPRLAIDQLTRKHNWRTRENLVVVSFERPANSYPFRKTRWAAGHPDQWLPSWERVCP